MVEIGTMTVPPPSLPVKAHCQALEPNQTAARQNVPIRDVSPLSSSALALEVGATVFVGGSASPGDSVETCVRQIPQVQSAIGYARRSIDQQQQHQQHQQHQQRQQAAHIVKIKINPDGDKNGRVISTVRLTLEENSVKRDHGAVSASATNPVLNEIHPRESVSESCVRISLRNNGDSSNGNTDNSTAQNVSIKVASSVDGTLENGNEMVQRRTTNSSATNSSSSPCFYYNSCQSPLSAMVMSSGQCSPSETLDSGTCSDLDGTPPPLPKKKNAAAFKVSLADSNRQHNRTASLTSSGAEVDSDDNESNISCDSLNGANADLSNTYEEEGDEHRDERPEEKSTNKPSERFRGILTEKPVDREMAMSESEVKNEKGCCWNMEDEARINEHSPDRQKTKDGQLKAPSTTSQSSQESLGSSPSPSPSLSPAPSPSPLSWPSHSPSGASSTPRVISPDPSAEVNQRTTTTASPVVREFTYEERKQEQERIEQEYAAADFYANYNRQNAIKYVYDDDRFYKFHVNELANEDEKQEGNSWKGGSGETEKDADECFAGYKILEREAIRSAKGTVRGVKNRVRAGIATFLQKPSTKDYKAKDAGKVVVYTTTSGIIRTSYYNCIKVNQILRTHMAKYEERDLFRSMEHQTELRDRLDCTSIELPQLFIDGQYIGDAETVDRLNESGELRRMLKPYKVETKISFAVCAVCGGFRMLLCEQCNGSKRSVFRNGFTTEFVGLRCMKCNEVGLVPCHRCNT